jgi:hypothetical protein
MNKLIITILSLIALIVVGAILWFFFFAPKQSPAPSENPSVALPISGSTSVPVTGTTATSSPGSTQTMAVGALGGGTVVTSDFIHNGETLPDAANKGRYLLVGNLGYCVSNPQECQAGTATDFSIFYDSNYGAFTIGLLNEPLGQVRLSMEQFLMNTLGITQKDMCKLNYYVGTTYTVNTFYSAKNLGFSFCPGATVLPK